MEKIISYMTDFVYKMNTLLIEKLQLPPFELHGSRSSKNNKLKLRVSYFWVFPIVNSSFSHLSNFSFMPISIWYKRKLIQISTSSWFMTLSNYLAIWRISLTKWPPLSICVFSNNWLSPTLIHTSIASIFHFTGPAEHFFGMNYLRLLMRQEKIVGSCTLFSIIVAATGKHSFFEIIFTFFSVSTSKPTMMCSLFRCLSRDALKVDVIDLVFSWHLDHHARLVCLWQRGF
jgi:hypothetical protein